MKEALHQTLFAEDDEDIYAVIDGAACEELLDKLDEFQPEHVCLYAGELEPDMQEVAPYLVMLKAGHPFTEWFLADCFGKHWGIFARSAAGLRTLRRHFRTFLLVKGPDAQTLYFRYYDPRVLTIYLPTADDKEREQVFGPVSVYFCEVDDEEFVAFRRKGAELERYRCFDAATASMHAARRDG